MLTLKLKTRGANNPVAPCSLLKALMWDLPRFEPSTPFFSFFSQSCFSTLSLYLLLFPHSPKFQLQHPNLKVCLCALASSKVVRLCCLSLVVSQRHSASFISARQSASPSFFMSVQSLFVSLRSLCSS